MGPSGAPWDFGARFGAEKSVPAVLGAGPKGFGCETLTPISALLAACSATRSQETQRTALPQFCAACVMNGWTIPWCSMASRRNLELDTNLAGGRDNTLQSVVDRCQTAMGSRLLTRWLNCPLRDLTVLQASNLYYLLARRLLL